MKKIIIIICILLGLIGMQISYSCSLPPDMIHEFRIDTSNSGTTQIHYTLMAWRNLHGKILNTIGKEINTTVTTSSLSNFSEKTLIPGAELFINNQKVTFIYLTGSIKSFSGNESDYTFQPENLIEISYQINNTIDPEENNQIQLKFQKTFWQSISYMVHSYIYTDIQKNGAVGSYIIGKDDRIYIPYTYLGKKIAFRNTLDEEPEKNTFTLFTEKAIDKEPGGSVRNNNSSENESITSRSYAQLLSVGYWLQSFFSETKNTGFQILGIIVAILAGMLHGLLPGHSKMLIGTYILRQKQSSYSEILYLISSITFSHTVFIFILATIVLMIQKGVSTVSTPVIMIAATGYILFGIYFVFQGYKNLKNIQEQQKKNSIFTTQNLNITPDCNCEVKQEYRGTILSGILAGCNPCIDALALFIFAVSIGNGFYAFLMIIFFSLGLGLMLGILAFSVSKSHTFFQKKYQKNTEKITTYITIFAGIAIIISGIFTLNF